MQRHIPGEGAGFQPIDLYTILGIVQTAIPGKDLFSVLLISIRLAALPDSIL